jgi:hypothetical protein
MSQTWTFESLREALQVLQPEPSFGVRRTFWIVERLLGVAIYSQNRYELFLVGPSLRPRSPVVRRHIEHGTWQGQEGAPFEANRIILPAAPHFLSVATLIAIEFLRAGLGEGIPLPQAFEVVEPFIELALRRNILADESILGLMGELLTLDRALLSVRDHPPFYSAVIDTWRGYQHSATDFVWGAVATEVKTTTLNESKHWIHSLAQVEAVGLHGKLPGAEIMLLSFGLTPSADGGLTIPGLVDRILGRLKTSEPGTLNPLQERFLHDLYSYGDDAGSHYDHARMRDWPAYQAAWTLTFTPRLYRLGDSDIRIIRRADLAGLHVSADHIRYRMDLPPVINATNPHSDWIAGVSSLVRSWLNVT